MSEKIYKNARKIFFDSPRFVVPRYQREYSWTSQQIDQLLLDIDNIPLDHKSKKHIVPKGNHFIGLLVFIDEHDKDGEPIYSLVDGQQRLSTFLLMAAAAKSIISIRLADPQITREVSEKLARIQSEFDDYIFISHRPFSERYRRLDPNINDKDIFEILVLSDGKFEEKRDLVQKKFGKKGLSKKYYKAFQHIYEYFLEQVNHLGDEYMVDFFVRYDSGVSFIPFISESDTDAFNLFESLNDRGMSLSAMDLIKNKLLSKAKQSDFEKYEIRWSEVIGSEGVISGEKAQTFIRNYLMIRKDHIPNSKVYDVCKELLPDADSAKEFIDEVARYANHYRAISEVSKSSENGIELFVADETIAEKLILLNKTKVKQWQSLALAAYSDFVDGKLQKAYLLQILELLLKMCLRFKIINQRFNHIEKPIPKLATSLHTNLINGVSQPYEEVVKHCINELTSLIDKYAQETHVFEALDRGYIFDDNELAFVMLRLLAVNGGHLQHGLAFSSIQKLTLEHVLPEKHERHWGDIENIDELKYSIGNMLLIEMKENVKLSNKNFEAKKEKYSSLNPLDLVEDDLLKYQHATQETWIASIIKSREADLVTQLKKFI